MKKAISFVSITSMVATLVLQAMTVSSVRAEQGPMSEALRKLYAEASMNCLDVVRIEKSSPSCTEILRDEKTIARDYLALDKFGSMGSMSLSRSLDTPLKVAACTSKSIPPLEKLLASFESDVRSQLFDAKSDSLRVQKAALSKAVEQRNAGGKGNALVTGVIVKNENGQPTFQMQRYGDNGRVEDIQKTIQQAVEYRSIIAALKSNKLSAADRAEAERIIREARNRLNNNLNGLDQYVSLDRWEKRRALLMSSVKVSGKGTVEEQVNKELTKEFEIYNFHAANDAFLAYVIEGQTNGEASANKMMQAFLSSKTAAQISEIRELMKVDQEAIDECAQQVEQLAIENLTKKFEIYRLFEKGSYLRMERNHSLDMLESSELLEELRNSDFLKNMESSSEMLITRPKSSSYMYKTFSSKKLRRYLEESEELFDSSEKRSPVVVEPKGEISKALSK